MQEASIKIDADRVHKLLMERLTAAQSEAVQWQVAYEQANEALARALAELQNLRGQTGQDGPEGAVRPAA